MPDLKNAGVKIGFKEQAEKNQSSAWKVPLKMKWHGNGTNEPKFEDYKGLVVEIQYENQKLVETIKLHIK